MNESEKQREREKGGERGRARALAGLECTR
jgi:hypothetical protein